MIRTLTDTGMSKVAGLIKMSDNVLKDGTDVSD